MPTQMLLQATYASYTWKYRITTDPDDFKRPPDLLGVLQECGAKVKGIWYSFGDFDFVALMEVADNVSAAALTIALRAGWDGKAFDRIVVTPLLDQNETAVATKLAAEGLHNSRDASKDGPLLGLTEDYGNRNFDNADKHGWVHKTMRNESSTHAVRI
jgi:uncharacterized protein with GYD domain